MDVNGRNFYPLILDILSDISNAHFVALDLELSGVPSKDHLTAQAGKPTLQQRYLETKQAAERYQILQIGLTCVEQDIENDKYVLKPYNFDLNPVISERLDVERIFSFQSGAIDFLQRNGFDISRPFKDGVPYLSREEAQLAREKHAKRQDKATFAEIEIKPEDIESLAFVQRVREEINTWKLSRRRDKPDFVNIASVAADAAAKLYEVNEFPEDLSRFEKRLIHQLVRAEYPDLVTVSKRSFIQIVHFNREREERIAAERRRELEERIARQKGFRWVIDALQGKNVSTIDLRDVAQDPDTGAALAYHPADLKMKLDRAQHRLRHNPRILVGHNCFLDLVYIYRTFVGALPATVEEFSRTIHELWPTVVDTKYLSTHNCGSINPVSSLEQIALQLSEQRTPKVEMHAQHEKYQNSPAYHEAGYDSYLTAQVAVRLSAKLDHEGASKEEQQQGKDETVRLGVMNMTLEEAKQQKQQQQQQQKQQQQQQQQQQQGLTSSNDATAATSGTIEAGWQTVVGKRSRGKPPASTPFLHGEDSDAAWKAKQRETQKHHLIEPNATLASGDGMPVFDSAFWKVYSNKLRVFGTQEGICVLDPPSITPPTTLSSDVIAATSIPGEANSQADEASDGGVAV